MKVIIIDKDRIVAKNLQVAANFWGRLKGLMGTPSLPEDSALLLMPCSGIHTFFMRYPIDAVFLDDHLRVLHIFHDLQPNHWGPPVKNTKKVLELPAGRCRQTAMKIGDRLQIIREG